jgi:hypothetical protein
LYAHGKELLDRHRIADSLQDLTVDVGAEGLQELLPIFENGILRALDVDLHHDLRIAWERTSDGVQRPKPHPHPGVEVQATGVERRQRRIA